MKIQSMDKNFVLYRCLHAGLLSPSNIEQKSTDVPGLPREQTRRNEKFLKRLIDVYGSCAMCALEGDYVVGYARFYPEIIYNLAGRKHICCQALDSPITPDMVEMDMPQVENLTDKTLRINCWFIHKDYQNQGISHLLLQGIVKWAREHEWTTIRACAAVNNFWVASRACTLMLRTYEKHGFQKTHTESAPDLEDYLRQIQQGKFGAIKQQAFEKHCHGKNLSDIAVYHTVECTP
jgi:ribosomal protein S18 acetylase RimI-like enzyme